MNIAQFSIQLCYFFLTKRIILFIYFFIEFDLDFNLAVAKCSVSLLQAITASKLLQTEDLQTFYEPSVQRCCSTEQQHRISSAGVTWVGATSKKILLLILSGTRNCI